MLVSCEQPQPWRVEEINILESQILIYLLKKEKKVLSQKGCPYPQGHTWLSCVTHRSFHSPHPKFRLPCSIQTTIMILNFCPSRESLPFMLGLPCHPTPASLPNKQVGDQVLLEWTPGRDILSSTAPRLPFLLLLWQVLPLLNGE